MNKTHAIELLGGSINSAAKTIGISYQAVKAWPDELPPRIADRVYAVWGRKNMPDMPQAPAECAQAATQTVAAVVLKKHDADHDSLAGQSLADSQVATQTVAVVASVNALRADRVRRLAERRTQIQRTGNERRAKAGLPVQSPVQGVA